MCPPHVHRSKHLEKPIAAHLLLVNLKRVTVLHLELGNRKPMLVMCGCENATTCDTARSSSQALGCRKLDGEGLRLTVSGVSLG